MKEHAPGLWTLSQPLPLAVGEIGCRMTIVRLPDGGLWLHSPVPLDDRAQAQIDRLGPVRHLVAPSKVHNLFVADASLRWPAAQRYGAPGLAEKRPQLHLQETLGDEAPAAWAGAIDQQVMRGAPAMNEVAFFHRDSRTLILTDLAFNVPVGGVRGAARVFCWLVGAIGRFGPHRIVKLGIRDKAAMRRSVEAMLAWDFDRVVVSHGDVRETAGHDALAASFAFLRGAG